MIQFRESWRMCLRLNAVGKLYREHLAENSREARGLRLMRDWLSPQQRAQFDGSGHFEVVGSDSGKQYRIYRGTAPNIYEVDEAGRLKVGWCFMPMGTLVEGDVILAQKIALETYENGALAVANRFPTKGGLRPGLRWSGRPRAVWY